MAETSGGWGASAIHAFKALSKRLPATGTDDAEKTDLTLPSYDVTNLRLDLYGVAKTPLDLSVFVRNVFDDEYAVAGGASGTFLGFETSIYGPPRMWGMEARYSF